MVYRAAKLFFYSVLVFLLAACSAPLPKIDLAPNAMSGIKTIAVVRPPETKVYAVINFGHGGAAFGLIGALVIAADQSNKQELLSKAYKENGVSISDELSRKISDRLNSLGFNARVEDGPWEEIDGKHVLSFKNIESNADAVLVISPSVIGFVATGLSGGYNNDYLPTIASAVFMFGKDRENPIYRGYHATGWKIKDKEWKYTPPVNRFQDFEAIYSNPKVSSLSLVDAAEKIVDSVMSDIKQQQGVVNGLARSYSDKLRAGTSEKRNVKLRNK